MATDIQASLRQDILSQKRAAPTKTAVLGWADNTLLKLLGVNNFVRFRDLAFVLECQKPSAQPIKNKIYATLGIFPLSILTNIALQKTFPEFFGGRSLRNVAIDLIWHTSTLFLLIFVNLRFTQQNYFKGLKNNLIDQRNRKYLAYMCENSKKFNINFEQNLYQVKKSQAELVKLYGECEHAYQEHLHEKRKKRVEEKKDTGKETKL